MPGLDAYLRAQTPLEPLVAQLDMAQRLTALVRQDPGRAWSLQQTASRLGASTRSLQRALAAEGTSFRHILRTARLSRAKAMLSGDASVTEIAHLLGFSDAAHFSRSFRRALGVSPSAWRQRR